MNRAGLRGAGILVLVATLFAPVALAGQSLGRDCAFEPGTESFRRQTFATSMTIYAVKARIRCAGGVRIRADSLTYYDARGYAELVGNVFYADSTRTMTAVRASYYRADRRLIANGDAETDVVVTNVEDGSRLSGLNLVYYQAGGGRLEDEVTVSGSRRDARPRALLPVGTPSAPTDSAATDSVADSTDVVVEEMEAESSPLDVTGDRILLRGESWFEAFGRVVSVRDSITTESDTLVYDEVGSTLDLRGNAQLVQVRDTIEGRWIRVRLPENEVREIETRGEGVLVSSDLRLEAPWFRVSLRDGEVDGLWAAPLRRSIDAEPDSGEVAVGEAPVEEAAPPPEPEPEVEADPRQTLRDSLDAAQPFAVSGETRIRADSLDVATTEGRVDQMVAVGRAYAVSARDSTLDVSMLPEIAHEDWMRGDTITATFASRTEADSTVYAIERIVASGSASSLYRLAPDSTTGPTPPTDFTDMPLSTAADSTPAPPPDSVGARVAADSLAVASDSVDASADRVVVLPSNAPGVHYVVAARIILVFANDEVSRMEVLGLEEGVHLEPRRASRPTADRRAGGGTSDGAPREAPR